MQWLPGMFSITVALASFMADDPVKLPAQAMRSKVPSNPGDREFGEARDRFDRAITTAHLELNERDAPAFTATVAAWGAWVAAALRAEAARTERDDYERTGYQARRGAFQEELVDKRRIYAQNKADAKRMVALIKSGEPVQDERRDLLVIDFQKSIFDVEQAETDLSLFERYIGPRQRQQLIDELERTSKEVASARSGYQAQRERLRRKMFALLQLQSSGSEWAGRLLGVLKIHAARLAPFNGPPGTPLDGPAGRSPQLADVMQGHRDAVLADVSQVFRTLARWHETNSALMTSLMMRR